MPHLCSSIFFTAGDAGPGTRNLPPKLAKEGWRSFLQPSIDALKIVQPRHTVLHMLFGSNDDKSYAFAAMQKFAAKSDLKMLSETMPELRACLMEMKKFTNLANYIGPPQPGWAALPASARMRTVAMELRYLDDCFDFHILDGAGAAKPGSDHHTLLMDIDRFNGKFNGVETMASKGSDWAADRPSFTMMGICDNPDRKTMGKSGAFDPEVPETMEKFHQKITGLRIVQDTAPVDDSRLAARARRATDLGMCPSSQTWHIAQLGWREGLILPASTAPQGTVDKATSA